MAARIVASNRKNGEILEHQGYRYTLRKSVPEQNKKYWRCVNRNTCNGTIQSNYNTSSGIIVHIGPRQKQHLHEPDMVEIEVQEVVRGIKRKAKDQPSAPPSAIYRDEVSAVSNIEVIANMPQRQDIIRTINRVQNRNRPQHPQSLAEINVHGDYMMTTSGNLFLQFDSGAADENRFLMFYTTDSLRKLCASRMVFGDGTFKVVPSVFSQLYSLHGTFNEFSFPMVYVLATRKDEQFYNAMLNQLRTHAAELNLNLDPQFIASDFELSFINAAKNLFPNSTLHGCLFHFTQNIWKNAVNKGLKVPFSEIDEVRSTIQCLLAIPFVPLDDIFETFDLIVLNSPQPDDVHNVPDDVVQSLTDLLHYVERIYVRGVTARGRRRAVPPRYPPQLWNVYNLVLTKQQRTTNIVEGWHSRFQRMIVQHHSGIWRFIEHLKKDQHESEIMMTQLTMGHSRIRHPVKGVIKKNQEMVERIVANYQNYKEQDNVITYLKAIGYKLKLQKVNPEEAAEAEDGSEE